MSQRFEGHFRGYQNIELFYQGWEIKNPAGNLIVTHGISEHSESYHSFASKLNQHGWNVYAWDLRGHGRSEGQRGYVSSFDEYEKDLRYFSRYLHKSYIKKDLPSVAFGHSMGGLITTKYFIAYGRTEFSGCVLSSPAMGINIEVPAWKAKAAKLANDWLPRLTLPSEIEFTDLNRDPDLLEFYPRDPLRHEKVSPRLYMGMMDSFNQLPQLVGEIQLPLLMQLAGLDKVVDSESAKAVFEKIGSPIKKLIVYENSLHEIYNDLENMQVFKDLFQFIDSLKEVPS